MRSDSWAHYLAQYRKRRSTLILVAFMSVAASAAMLPTAYSVKQIFDVAIPDRDKTALLGWSVAIVCMQLLNSGLMGAIRFLTLRATKDVITGLRKEVILKVQRFSYSAFLKLDLAETHTVIVQDTERVDIMSNALVAMILPAVLMVIILIPVLIFLNLKLFMILLASTPLILLFSRAISRVVRGHVNRFHRSFEQFSKGVLFFLKGYDLTRLLVAEESEKLEQHRHAEELRETSQQMAWLSTVYRLTQNVLSSLLTMTIIVSGGLAVARGTMTLGDVISFFAVLIFLRGQVSTINANIPKLIEGRASLDSLNNFLGAIHREPYEGTLTCGKIESLTLDSVRFGFGEAELLRDISLNLSTGRAVGMVGVNGCGKSTIINLLLGYYKPWNGRIKAGDLPYEEVDIRSLRRQVGVLRQQPFIFQGTIRENLIYGRRGVSDNAIEIACRSALANEFIQSLPRAFDTVLGEEGEQLSGGQQQRLALARALLGEPQFLLLDEPSTHLDSEVIANLVPLLSEFCGNKGLLVISHDPEILSLADEVVNLDRGRLTRTEPVA